MKNIIFVRYSSGTPGVVTREWARDKIMGFEDLGFGVTLITSTMGSQMSTDSVRVIKVPSLSCEDFMQESGARWKVKGKRVGSLSKLLSVVALVLSLRLGRVFDTLFVRLAGSHSDGRWSWFFFATPVTIWQVIRGPSAVIVSTGGPLIAHLVGLVSAKLTGRKFFCEAQDILLGSEMQMFTRARRVVLVLEKSLAKHASRLIFVTKAAAKTARARTPDYGSKIVSIYPGAYAYESAPHDNNSMHDQNQMVLVHLGHLYGSRADSFDKFEIGAPASCICFIFFTPRSFSDSSKLNQAYPKERAWASAASRLLLHTPERTSRSCS